MANAVANSQGGTATSVANANSVGNLQSWPRALHCVELVETGYGADLRCTTLAHAADRTLNLNPNPAYAPHATRAPATSNAQAAFSQAATATADAVAKAAASLWYAFFVAVIGRVVVGVPTANLNAI